jgi:hypothetical protein
MKRSLLSVTKKISQVVVMLFFIITASVSFAQNDIFEMMERTDMTLRQTEAWANDYFARVGTGQGTGFKQYQRWLYERRFHVDQDGYLIRPELEDKLYHEAIRNMGLKSTSAYNWLELGPTTWTYTSGWNPGVGRVTSVAVHPSSESTIYVSSPGGGIWKSTNGGGTWTPLIDFVNSSWMNVFHLCIDPLNQATIYASLSSGGVLKSTNSGVSWSATGSGPSGAKQVKVHPANSSIVFCAANNGIWRSVNGGSTWTQVETSTKEDIEFNPANPDIMYASGSSGTSCVWRSADNGLTWTAITSTSGITNTGRTLLAVSANDPNVVYAVQASGSIFGRMYRSNDAGLTYITTVVGSASSGTNYFGYEPTGTGTTGQATYDMAVCANPLNASEVHIAGIICWKSLDGGVSFVATTVWSYPNSTGYNHADVHALEWVNSTIYSGSDGGVYKSLNNAGDWTDLSAGLGIRQFYRIACSKTNPSVVTGGAQDNGSAYRRTNGSWVDWLGADGMDNVISPVNADIAIGTSQYGAIYKTTNAGASRTNLTQPSSGNWITPLVMHPTSHDTVWGGWTGVWKSVNGGTNWTNLSPGITVKLDVLAVASSNTKYIYASTGTTLYRTTDGGPTWSTLTAPSTITSIFVSKYDPLKIWITCNSTSNRVFLSTDGGTTFTNISTGLPSLAARSVVVDEDASGTIYVGMNIGVYYRDDITNTWTEHAPGLPLVAVNEVELQKSGNKLRVATYGRGVWESDLRNVQLPCNPPSGLTTTNITSGSATIGWSAVSGAVSYKVEYKESASSTWIIIDAAWATTTANLTGLLPGTAYDWRVATNCSALTSAYTNASFTTMGLCDTPTGLTVTGNTSSTATLAWNTVAGATSYDVEYKPVASSTWTVTAGVVTNSATISSLASGSYDWRVKANCPAGGSNYATSVFAIYCVSNGSSTTAGYVDYVSLGSISRTSGSDGGYYNGYSSYNTNLVRGSSYTLTFSPGYSGAKKNTYWRFYIDYNLDGDFADAGEQIGQKTFKNLTNSTITFTVPTSATLGISRLRVVMSTTAYQSSCGTYTSGETEDFKVSLSTTPELQSEQVTPAEDHSLTIYPNPANTEIRVRFNLATEEPFAGIRIYDITGKVVFGTRIPAVAGVNEQTLNVGTLSTGQYILMLRTNSFSKAVNMIIAR